MRKYSAAAITSSMSSPPGVIAARRRGSHTEARSGGDRASRVFAESAFTVAFPIKGDKSSVACWWEGDTSHRSAILEGEPGAGDEIPDRPRDQHFARPCGGSGACASRDGDAGHLVVGELALACVKAGAKLDAEHPNIISDRLRAADRTCRAVEAGEEAVAGSVHLDAAEA